MGVYINGMEMPTKGYRLILVHADGTAQTTDGETTAVPVPPHGDLIDRDALDIPYDICDGNEAMDFVNASPTVIPAEPGEEET